MNITTEEMIKINKKHGYHTFDKDTMKFWNSRIYTAPNEYGFFITSEDDYTGSKIMFSIRAFSPHTGDVTTIRFQTFAKLSEAKAYLEKLMSVLEKQTGYREQAILEDLRKITSTDTEGVFKVSAMNDEYFLFNTNNLSRAICG